VQKKQKDNFFYIYNDLPRKDYIHARRVVIKFIFAAKIDNDDVLSLIFFHTYQRYCRMGCQNRIENVGCKVSSRQTSLSAFLVLKITCDKPHGNFA
jgi:hypothetical protein